LFVLSTWRKPSISTLRTKKNINSRHHQFSVSIFFSIGIHLLFFRQWWYFIYAACYAYLLVLVLSFSVSVSICFCCLG
jgi:hypothetical protein